LIEAAPQLRPQECAIGPQLLLPDASSNQFEEAGRGYVFTLKWKRKIMTGLVLEAPDSRLWAPNLVFAMLSRFYSDLH
jgi:hypothetical protein